MRCPYCSNEDTQVKDSRPTEDNTAIRRRRFCECGARFTTFERIQLRDLIVLKKNNQKEIFDRDKIFRSISLALRKRNIEQEKIERIVNGIVRRLENLGETEIKTSLIGELIMDALFNLDQVAYVRFASVYKNFREAKDFEDFLGNLEEK
ncbi:MAG: Transcriptional repressor NrdR [Alphaproteobacteria bacterium MarineAlpha5_Bin11]|nr:transcriptional regulator NrdR [Pelagibacteraceae bacterium]PPR42753.1 MAG: Transcriptional repressor NrdR [Alphaproteobacteria bacterium MarineAlpha5_Bin11]|tara:strand:- start:609 stop:1058 length:450 start_codon:yes stop_codon:yes gene_type:complete